MSRSFSLSPGQQRLWFLHELRGGSNEYHVPEVYRLTGILDEEALASALTKITERHEILRVAIGRADGRLVQRTRPVAPVKVPVEDLRGLTEDERRERERAATRREWDLPFDLTTGPLLRARLLRVADEEHVLLLTIHHIVTDGWSQGLIRRELEALYTASCQDGPAPPPPSATYADYVRATEEPDAARDAATRYWAAELDGAPDLLALPTDRPRRESGTGTGGMLRLGLDAAFAERIRRLGAGEGATLYMTLLAGFAALMSRCARQREVVVGTPVANRAERRWEDVVGFFVNTLALRFEVPPDVTFRELLGQVRQRSLAGLEHQRAPFERVVRRVGPERRADRTPLFQVLFALAPTAATGLRLPGLTCETLPLHGAWPRFDLELHVGQDGEGLSLTWVYDADLFDHDRIAGFGRGYLRILEQAAADPAAPVPDWHTPAGVAPPVREPAAPADRGPAADEPRVAALREIFGEVLGLPDVGVDDDFFALGGHSLMAMSLIEKVQDKFGVELAISDVFATPTVATMAAALPS